MTKAKPCIIRGLSVLSAVGGSASDWEVALAAQSAPCGPVSSTDSRPVFRLSDPSAQAVSAAGRMLDFEGLDRVTLCAVASAHETLKSLSASEQVGCVSIGSSRGPTASLEHTVREFDRRRGSVPVITSPITTAGNISSWVMQDYLRQRDLGAAALAALSTSMTCSSALHSLLIARSFLLSNMARVCLFGGAEACLTPYSISQMEALKIYAREVNSWPCQPFGSERGSLSSVVLGEGAGSALLLSGEEQIKPGDLALLGVGWAVEPIPSATGISSDGDAFKAAMSMAQLEARGYGVSKVDAVIAHAPGTQKGDAAELAAIYSVFGADTGVLSTKHLTGHTYGASGMVSLSLASAVLDGVEIRGFPYPSVIASSCAGIPDAVAINTAGFGGNAISIIVGKRPNRLVYP